MNDDLLYSGFIFIFIIFIADVAEMRCGDMDSATAQHITSVCTPFRRASATLRSFNAAHHVVIQTLVG